MLAHSKSWNQVGQKLEVVGTQLRRLVDETHEDDHADRAAFEKAVHALFAALDESLEATSKIVRDPVLRKDLGALAEAVREAVKTTVEGAREQVSATAGRLPKAPKRSSHKSSPTAVATTKRSAHATVRPQRTASGKPAAHKQPTSKRP